MTRSLPRRTAVIGAFLLATLVWWSAPGYAHDSLRLTVQHDGHGSVWVTAVWRDGHPVTEVISATVSARESAGRLIAPEPMRPGPSTGTVVYPGTLAAGRWTVTVDADRPGRGSCTAVLTVGPDRGPESVACADAPAAVSDEAGGATNLVVTLVAVGAVAAAAVTAVVLVRRRLRTPTT
ncbi:hypothetical protein [Plantactinospora sp. CA-290183]|uniref:hypothetical protein n=1 Tax=Plantactinospora sp. CA-290183 TaxID=3240006 RepID=UPI003D92F241